MSSTYRILCLSHDPALIVDDAEWSDLARAVAAVNNRSSHAVADHANCYLLIGRWSGGLVEVCCPRTTSDNASHSGWHPHDDYWIGAGWLRLLALADPSAVSQASIPGCWSGAGRLLRRVLGVGEVRADG